MTTRAKILVVDDKSDIVETVSFCLTQEGFEVSTAFDGEQALKVACREQPDLIVLDVMLPKENGYQVARYLRDDYKGGRGRDSSKNSVVHREDGPHHRRPGLRAGGRHRLQRLKASLVRLSPQRPRERHHERAFRPYFRDGREPLARRE